MIIALFDFDGTIITGDNHGDKELLELANERFYKPFKDD